MKLTYCLLAISIIIALFNRNRVVVYFCIALTCIAAVYEHVITLSGAQYLVALAVLTLLSFSKEIYSKLRAMFLILLIALLAGFVLHFIPGINNQLIVNKYVISINSHPVSIRIMFDKVCAALILFAFSPLMTKESKIDGSAFKQTFLTLFACITVILGPAIFSGYVKLDPKFPAILPLWAAVNFLFVCFSEEVIYRGFLQAGIKNYLPRNWKYTCLAILIASIVFGLAHYRDGIIFMGLAAIAGLFYGYAYDRTKRVLCAMLVHFSLNLTHFLVFTY